MGGQRLTFASELKAFDATQVPRSANVNVVRDFLEHGITDHTADTFFEVFTLSRRRTF